MPRSLRDRIKQLPGATNLYNVAFNLAIGPIRKYLFRRRGATRFRHNFSHPSLSAAIQRGVPQSDISDHLGTIFFFALETKPRLMVELGTRGGESTRALLAVSSLTEAPLLSIDINECGKINIPHQEYWTFIKADDVEFGRAGFEEWCRKRGLDARADVIFLDTSHEFSHTQAELDVWTRHLSDDGILMLHDTNMGPGLFSRTDGSVEFGWDNQRGVIAALEGFLGREYDETSFFYDYKDGFAVMHFPYSSGLTVLRKCKIPVAA